MSTAIETAPLSMAQKQGIFAAIACTGLIALVMGPVCAINRAAFGTDDWVGCKIGLIDFSRRRRDYAVDAICSMAFKQI